MFIFMISIRAIGNAGSIKVQHPKNYRYRRCL
jgi:hypothetical protein